MCADRHAAPAKKQRHAHPPRKGLAVLHRVPRLKQRRLVEQPCRIERRLIVLIGSHLFEHADNEGMPGVDLNDALAHSKGLLLAVAHGLRRHDALHVGAPAIPAGWDWVECAA